MTRYLSLVLLVLVGPAVAPAAELPKPLLEGLINPSPLPSDRRQDVRLRHRRVRQGRRRLRRPHRQRQARYGPERSRRPKGIAFFGQWIFIADKTKVLRVDLNPRSVAA